MYSALLVLIIITTYLPVSMVQYFPWNVDSYSSWQEIPCFYRTEALPVYIFILFL